MRMTELNTLRSLGFTNGASCPVTNVVAPNMVRNFDGYAISYNSSSADYGCPTTALVLDHRVFFILNGNHTEALVEAAEDRGIDGCVDVFIANLNQANDRSEHGMATGIREDLFELMPTTLNVIGQPNVNRIAQAIRPEVSA